MGKAAVLLLLPQLALSLRPAGWLSHPCSRSSSSTPLRSTTRRAAAQSALFAAAAAATSLQLPARAHASIEPGLSLDDLPSKAVQAYRQYWPAMQLAGDFYVFELKELTFSPGNWDQIGEEREREMDPFHLFLAASPINRSVTSPRSPRDSAHSTLPPLSN